MEYICEADLIRYAWFGPWAADARRCAIALIGLNNYRHARRIGQIVI
jgi:hypothetical protein